MLLMHDRNNTHQIWVPLGYTFSWLLGICLGCDFFDFFGRKELSLDDNPAILLFYSAISVYFAYLVECIFIFIDFGALYKDERFSGKIFNIIAGIMFHFFTTMLLVGMLISNIDDMLIYILTFWVVMFKFGISLVAANIENWLADIKIQILTSNIAK